ncbi:unnamed protein product [Chilo suppressalis]|uniref:Protein peste n=1 Tax=Chilo suppressalis TaxID=168631 RepID=A0ABN8BE78_CHISP|nr:unnamed protein product [Chilo suppressalis]
MRGRTPRWRWLVAGGGALLAVGALGAALAWSLIFDSILASQLALTPSSRSYKEWVAPAVPLYFEIYLFNWTNAADFPAEKPILVELGPYRFREHRRHVNVTWHHNNDSLSYRTLRSWHYDPTSNGSLNDNITTLNVIAASAVFRSRFWGYFQQKGLSMGLAMFGQRVSVSKTARELLFDGYEDPLLDLAKSLPASTTGGAPPVDRFGWFYERNNSLDTDGFMEVTIGNSYGSLPGQILRWNHEDSLPFYGGKCSRLEGSVGEFLPRDLSEESRLTMFLPDLCRTVNMDYRSSGQMLGLNYHKYELSEGSFDNSSLSLSNTCFCGGACAWGGVMNVSACRFGSPTFVSLPHFLRADPALRAGVDGMKPDPEKHSFYFAVEPRLGIPVEVAARFQINVYLEPSPNVALYEHVPRMLFPVFWVQQRVTLDSNTAQELSVVRGARDWGATACAAAALLLAAVAALATCCPPHVNKKLHRLHDDLKHCCPSRIEFSDDQDKIKEDELKLNPM